MEFGEAMDLLKRGSKVVANGWNDGIYIELCDSGEVFYNDGTIYTIDDLDLEDEWHIYNEFDKGTRLTAVSGCSVNDAIVVRQDDSMYQIVDTTNWEVIEYDIAKSDLPDIIKDCHLEKK